MKPDVFVTGDIPSPLIGEGFRRKVYAHPDGEIVYKIAKDGEEKHNQIEWENWERLKGTEKGKWLAPCLSLTPGGKILVQKRVEIVDTPKEVPDWIKTQRDWEIGGNKTKPWGMYEGHPVLVDYGDQLFRYLTEEEFMAQVATQRKSNPEHWGVDDGKPGQPKSTDRWEYHYEVIKMLREIRPDTILEVGTMGIQIANDSDTIDIGVPEWNWRLVYKPTYEHDLTQMPWPVQFKGYDAFVALRVFHHMGDEERCLNEMMRVATHIVLAVTTESAKRYNDVKPADRVIRCEKTDTVILYYKA